MIRCLYVRVSTEAQAEEGFSIEAQKQRLEGFCVSKGWENQEFFVDAGFSGSNLDRPAMNAMISAISEGKVQSVLVYKLDRLSRSQKDTLFLIEDLFLPHNVDFISLNESIDTSTPYGRAMIGILSAFAQLERENIYLRTRMGMLERVKQGYWMGGGTIPYGYDYDKEQGILVPNPIESALVGRIYDLYLKGESPQNIAEKLGFSYDRLVTQIIDRRTNLGLICYKGTEYQGRHQPIISEEIFYSAQERRKKRQVSPRKEQVHLLSGLIFCGSCGNRLRYHKWGKSGYKLRCYSLDKSKSYMNSGRICKELAVWAEEVEEIVEKDIISLSFSVGTEKKTSTLDVYEKEIQDNQRKLKRLYDIYSGNGDETLLAVIEERKKTHLQLKKGQESEQGRKAQEKAMVALQNRVCTLGEGWDQLSAKEKQGIYRDCIEKIEISQGKTKIFYRFLLNTPPLDFL